MKNIQLLVILMVLLTGLIWVSGTSIDQVEQDNNSIGDNVTQEEAQTIYKPVSSLLTGLVTAIPYAITVAIFVGALYMMANA